MLSTKVINFVFKSLIYKFVRFITFFMSFNGGNINTTRIANLFLREDGILQIDFKHSIEINRDDVVELGEKIKEVTQGVAYPTLINTGKNSTANYAAREYSARELNEVRTAEAYVTTTVYHRFLANFYVQFHRPKTPAKVFASETEASKWLQQYKLK